MQELWCRYPDCGHSLEIVAGFFPTQCPKCLRESRWTTEPAPKVPFALTHNDRQFLRSIKVEATEPEDDGA